MIWKLNIRWIQWRSWGCSDGMAQWEGGALLARKARRDFDHTPFLRRENAVFYHIRHNTSMLFYNDNNTTSS